MVEGSFDDLEYMSDSPPEPDSPPETDLSGNYYYVHRGQYFYYDNGNSIPLSSRPDQVWVYHTEGWKDTGRTKHWRFCDGGSFTYQ
jgi:hypothetical protein